MKNLMLTEVFCTRLLHDLLSPVGALQLAVDSWKQMPNEACASLIENSMQAIVDSLNLLRKTYGYTSAHLNQEQVHSITTENFGDKITYTSDIPVFWNIHILRTLVWLKYKLLESSTAQISFIDDQMIIDIQGIYLNEEELDLIDDKKVEMNSYLIYLILLLEHLNPNIKLEVEVDKPKCKMIFTKISF